MLLNNTPGKVVSVYGTSPCCSMLSLNVRVTLINSVYKKSQHIFCPISCFRETDGISEF